jgi:hypothetical protein
MQFISSCICVFTLLALLFCISTSKAVKSALLIIPLLLCTTLSLFGAKGAKVFTDKNGKTFKGTLMEVIERADERGAKIRRFSDGRIFLVPLDKLSEESRKYVEANSFTLATGLTQTLSSHLAIGGNVENDYPEAPPWLKKGIKWLCKNQSRDGMWGLAGTSVLNVRRGRQTYPSQPNAGSGDAGTTAVAVMALTNYLCKENDPNAQAALKKGVRKLLELVRKKEIYTSQNVRSSSSRNAMRVAPTLVERKLGPRVNVALVAQALAKLYLALPESATDRNKIGQALDTCLEEIADQHDQFIRPAGGWASILQTTSSLVAWEYAELCDRKVPKQKIEELRNSLTAIFNERMNAFDLSRSAGVNLYSFASSIRANASTAATASAILPEGIGTENMSESANEAVANPYGNYPNTSGFPQPYAGVRSPGLGTVVPEPIDPESDPTFLHLRKKMSRTKALELSQAYRKNTKLLDKLERDDGFLRGFGNNGGEEYLSFYLIGQSLQLSDEDSWGKWREKVVNIVKPLQEDQGSWVGQHCITDRSFCTATVILSILVDREGSLLREIPEPAPVEESSSGLVNK